jgi:hypothetical protein
VIVKERRIAKYGPQNGPILSFSRQKERFSLKIMATAC